MGLARIELAAQFLNCTNHLIPYIHIFYFYGDKILLLFNLKVGNLAETLDKKTKICNNTIGRVLNTRVLCVFIESSNSIRSGKSYRTIQTFEES